MRCAFVFLLLAGCPPVEQPLESDDNSQVDEGDLTVALEAPAFGYQLVTEPTVIQPGEERYLCSVLRIDPLDGESLVWINEIESLSSEASHHFNVWFGTTWTFADAFLGDGAAEAILGVPLGTHDCDDLGDLMETAMPLAPSQRTHQTLSFPEGVAMPWFSPGVLAMEHHYINTTTEPVTINAAVNFKRTDEEDVTDLIGILWATAWNFEIPPEQQMMETRTCIMPFDANIAIFSTHTHERAQCATINLYDSDANAIEADPLFVNKDWERPPIQHFGRDELFIPAGDGFHYGCHFYNPESDRTVHSGLTSADEMCMAVAGVYPVPVTKQEIIEVAENLDIFEAMSLIDQLILDCAHTPEGLPASPWPLGAQAEPGPPTDICGEFEQTQSN